MAINRYSDGRIYRGKGLNLNLNNLHQKERKEKKTKYGNEKTEFDNIKFDSKKEARHYTILTQLKKAGYIKDFTMQVKYTLQEKYKNALGKTIREIKYFADFDVIGNDDVLYSIDSKGYENEVFRIKKKIFEYKFDRPLYCIKNDSELHKLFIKE